MNTAVDRVNRILLALLGLALLVGGALGLARSLGWLGDAPTADPVLPAGAGLTISDEWWFWPAAVALCLLLVLLCLWWLLAQLRTDRLRQLEVDRTRAGGETWLRTGAIEEAVAGEVATIPGVSSARMAIAGAPERHRHRLVVDLTDRADIDAVRSELATRTIPNIRQALDFEDPEVDIELVLAPGERRRLR
jgi:hypothetical protein